MILYETGFEKDSLGRSRVSKQLSGLVEKLEDPVVIALDDKWGSGKSYFLKRWVAAHTNENEGTATTVYFDAFENDYLSEPLVALIGAISERIPDEQESLFEKVKTVGAKLAKPLFGIALSWATFGAKQHLDDMGDAIAEAANGEAKDAASALWAAEAERKDAIQSFKDLLSELTEGDRPPLVIVVDELDRCRPDYALSVLEIIKHFFAVPKVHFVLGINGEALENSVKARYGADIDAERYLRKFINVSFSLPRTIEQQGSVSTLYAYAKQASREMELPDELADRCIKQICLVARRHDVSLRDVGKILSNIALLPSEAGNPKNHKGYTDILCVLLVSSVVSPNFHTAFIQGEVLSPDIIDYLGSSEDEISEKIGDDYNENYDPEVAILAASMIYCTNPDEMDKTNLSPMITGNIGQQFGGIFSRRNPTGIPAQLQSDWVDVFRI